MGDKVGAASVMIVLAIIMGACADATVPPASAVGLEPLPGFDTATVVVDGDHEFSVMLASSTEQRRQGLMHVVDLGDWAGMVFAFDEPTDSGFWMKETVIPLTIFWVDASGGIVATADMDPCPLGDGCPAYRPGAQYTWALEIEVGAAADLGITATSRLEVIGHAADDGG